MSKAIRPERPEDYRKAEELIREAFWNLYLPGGSEHYLLHTMRSHPDYLPELSLVLEKDGELAGAIYFTRAKIVREGGCEIPVVSFGPVGIAPRFQHQGLGRQLIWHSIKKARDEGHPAIVIGGDPNHYRHYGFAGSKRYGIAMPDGKYYTGIQALPLYPEALRHAAGKMFFSPAMEPDLSGLAEFDKTFPPAEKREQESQRWFLKASTEIDTRDYGKCAGQ